MDGFNYVIQRGYRPIVAVVKNSGSVVYTGKKLNLVEGANITLTVADDVVNNQVDITINATGTGDYDTIQEEGTSLTQRTTMNFIGSGITAVDNAGATRTDISLDNTLNSLSQFNTNGLLTQTAADTFVGIDDSVIPNRVLVAGLGSGIIRVNTTGGVIEVGDLLTTSDVAGEAMKYTGIPILNVLVNDGSVIVAKARQSWSHGHGTIACTLMAG